MSFTKDMRAFAKRAGTATSDTSNAIKVELLSSVVLDTPVDTGRARGNWQVTENTPALGTTERLTKSGNAVLRDINASIGQDVTWMSNNLPYIERLENGYSKKSPAGMVRKNVARIRRIISKAIRENKI